MAGDVLTTLVRKDIMTCRCYSRQAFDSACLGVQEVLYTAFVQTVRYIY